MKHLSAVAIAVCLASGAIAQDRVTLNTITRIEVKGSTIEIQGSRKASFATFTLSKPARLVIDISEAVFSGVPAEIAVSNGSVTAIKTIT